MTSQGTKDLLEWGAVGGCRYLVTNRLDMGSFLRACRSILDHRLVWITAFDCGPLTPTNEERAAGWSVIDDIAVSPVVTSDTELPHDNNDEWWVDVQEHAALRDSCYCCRGSFMLADLSRLEAVQDPSWDPTRYEIAAELQRKFWTAFWASKAEMYVSDGDSFFTFVSRDRRAFEVVLAQARR